MKKLLGSAIGFCALMGLVLSASTQGQGGQAGGPAATGKVASVDAAKKSFTVESKQGVRNVTTNDKTEIIKNSPGKLSDVKQNAVVAVGGRLSDDFGSIEAAVITVQPEGTQPGKAPAKAAAFSQVRGTVVATGDTIKVKTRDDKEVNVKTTAETRVFLPGKGSFDDIKVGTQVVVAGTAEGDNVTAARITIGGGLGKAKGKGN